MGWAFVIFATLSLIGCNTASALPVDRATPISSPDETKEHDAREAIIQKISAAMAAKDFRALDAMGEELRTSRARTPAGAWDLWVYHAQIRWQLGESVDRTAACRSPMESFVREWQEASPKSHFAPIAQASLLIDEAWCFRGGGSAAAVPEQAWAPFAKKTQSALAVLHERQEQASLDPEFYAVQLEAMRMQGADRKAFDAVLAEGSKREPAYENAYVSAAYYFLPQWGGSYAQIDALARLATDKSRNTDGSSMYARIFRSLEECGCDVISSAADWNTMKQSMRDLYARFPVRNNAEYFANLSCRLGDRDEGRRYIRALHPEATGEGDFAALFASCDKKTISL